MGEALTQPGTGLHSLSRRQISLTLMGVMITLFLSSLDQTIVATAMPRIVADLGGFEHYTWLTIAYLTASTVILPITGRLTDMYGRKLFYIGGIVVFVVGSFLAGLSQTMTQIIIFRALQGAGAGVILANAFTVIGDLFPPSERGKYQGLLSAVFGISAVIGPALGGFITDNLSWHWVFYINIPLGILTIVLFAIFFPNIRMDSLKHRIDYAGITALVFAVVPLLLALSWGGSQYPWDSAPILGMFVVAAAAIIAFLLIESKSAEPILPLGIFGNPIVAMSVSITFFTAFGIFGGIIFVPLFLQGVLGLSATASGSFLTPMILGSVVGSFLSGQLLARTGGRYRIQGAFGLGFMAFGLGLLARMTPETSYPGAIVNIVLVGFGLGILMPLYIIAVQNAVPHRLLGTVTSAVPFFRSLGGAVGLAVFGSMLTNRFAAQFLTDLPQATKAIIPPQLLSSVTHNAQVLVSPGAQAQLRGLFDQMGPQGAALYEQTVQVLRQSLSSALTQVFLIAMAITILAFVLNLFLKEIPLRRHHAAPEPAGQKVMDASSPKSNLVP